MSENPTEPIATTSTAATSEPAAPPGKGAPALSSTSAAKIKTFDGSNFDTKKIDWWTLTVEEVQHLVVLEDLSNGVKKKNVATRREEFGSNLIPVAGGISIIKIIFNNFCNSITAILVFVAVVSGIFEDWAALGIVIFVILFVGIIGVYQEYNAEASLESLKTMTKGTATVIRDGLAEVIKIDDVVIGDVLVLEQGTLVPCDCRVINATGLEIDEGLLTGEAMPVFKKTVKIPDPEKKCALGDRKNLAFRNTQVTSGRGRGICIAAGLDTEMGKLAARLQSGETNPKTPLQIKMDKLMYAIFGVCIILVIVVFASNRFKMTESTIIYGAAVAIAILPQSLVAVVAVAMAVSVRRMATQQCIVRKIGTLEVLDSVTDICSDKTGTLTKNKMVVARMFIGLRYCYVVSGNPLEVAATFKVPGPDGKPQGKAVDIEEKQEKHLPTAEFFRCAALCGTTTLSTEGADDNILVGAGNPTEIALQAMAWKGGHPKGKIQAEEGFESKGEYPFDSTIKRMCAGYYQASTHRSYVCCKGAPERVLKLCPWKLKEDGSVEDLTEEDRNVINDKINAFADLGLRTICLSMKKTTKEEPVVDLSSEEKKLGDYHRNLCESDLIYLGIVGIYDPPRDESKLSVNICHRAGINVRMLTGDHFATAAAIAKEINIIDDAMKKNNPYCVMIGPDFDKLTTNQFMTMEELPFVIGRCSPDTKVGMIDELHRRGHVCAMTGDGFNDSPSIKAADIGCAMGSGTDVTKGVADFVITDDNFSTIVKAVAEGRRIALSLSKFVTHLLCGNMAETVVLICGLGIQKSQQSVFVLSPMEILWLNLFTSSPPAIGLSMDDAGPDILRIPPNRKGLFTLELLSDTITYGIILGGASLGSFVFVLYGPGNGTEEGHDCNSKDGVGCDDIWQARATAYNVLYFGMLIHAYNVRFARKSLFLMPILDNAWLWGSFLFGAVTMIPQLYVETIATNVFVHRRLTWEWGVIGVALVIFIVGGEIYKLIKNAVDPIPVQPVSEEEERNEEALFRNDLRIAQGTEAVDTRPLTQIVEEELLKSFTRQASFGSAPK